MGQQSTTSSEGFISRLVSIGKDLVALLRDGTLFILTLLLIVFPSTFNSILVSAGFEEGSFVGLKWKSNLEVTNESLDEANALISELQAQNDDLVSALDLAKQKIDAATNVSGRDQFEQTIGKLKEDNISLKTSSEIVQTAVSQRVQSNISFIEKTDRSLSARKSDYLVGLQTLGLTDLQRQNLNQKIEANGYSLNSVSASYKAEQRPSWLSYRSSVFYYSASAREQAMQLALLLQENTGQAFQVERGAGTGVRESLKDVTLFVHYIKN